MENWGILSYRDKFLFYDKTDSSELNKQVKIHTNLKGNVSVIKRPFVHDLQWCPGFRNLIKSVKDTVMVLT